MAGFLASTLLYAQALVRIGEWMFPPPLILMLVFIYLMRQGLLYRDRFINKTYLPSPLGCTAALGMMRTKKQDYHWPFYSPESARGHDPLRATAEPST